LAAFGLEWAEKACERFDLALFEGWIAAVHMSEHYYASAGKNEKAGGENAPAPDRFHLGALLWMIDIAPLLPDDRQSIITDGG
jgi:hypothetical protein